MYIEYYKFVFMTWKYLLKGKSIRIINYIIPQVKMLYYYNMNYKQSVINNKRLFEYFALPASW